MLHVMVFYARQAVTAFKNACIKLAVVPETQLRTFFLFFLHSFTKGRGVCDRQKVLLINIQHSWVYSHFHSYIEIGTVLLHFLCSFFLTVLIHSIDFPLQLWPGQADLYFLSAWHQVSFHGCNPPPPQAKKEKRRRLLSFHGGKTMSKQWRKSNPKKHQMPG